MADPNEISASTIAAAERLAQVRYTEAERALMLETIGEQIALAASRRNVALPTGLGPATRFDPRLPGFRMPAQAPLAVPPANLPLPDNDVDIAFAPMTALSSWLRSGRLSAERLAGIYLARIARLAPALHCFALVDAQGALARARELDRMLAAGTWLGPLHGIPWGAKDILDTAGIETAWGAEPYRGRVPLADATVVRRLHAAGAVLLGKTSVGALAYGDLWYGGRTRNPWNTEEGSRGSSAGSAAATAAGLAAFCLGTETLGSIVIPACRTGVTGLRPTFGRVPRTGAMPLCWTLDKIGPTARSVADTALVLAAINGADPEDPFGIDAPFGGDLGRDVAGLRVGYFPPDFELDGAEAVERAALHAAQKAGLVLVPLDRPELPYGSLMSLLAAEAAASFEELTLSDRDDELSWQSAAAWPNGFRQARFLSAVDHVQLDRLRRLVMQVMDGCFAQVDAIIGPSLAGPMMIITNFTGHPCLCLPAGFISSPSRQQASLSRPVAASAEGPRFTVPHNICLWGKLFDEGTILAIGRALEEILGTNKRRPLVVD